MKIFVGYDPREDIAYQVCEYSIKKHTPGAEVIPLKQSDLRAAGKYFRSVDRLASTEFTFTRFLVPSLCDFEGWAVFMDCDTLVKTNLSELFALANDDYAVQCVKHEYRPNKTVKMDNCKQTVYPRKNWSSVMLFNCAHEKNKKLTVDFISDENLTGAYFHRFSWLEDELIGEIDHRWNFLTDWYADAEDAHILHYTEGGPWFKNYRHCAFNEDWKAMLIEMLETKS